MVRTKTFLEQASHIWTRTIPSDGFRDLGDEPVANVRTRELTKKSLKKLINQLKEEIVRFEAHQVAATKL